MLLSGVPGRERHGWTSVCGERGWREARKQTQDRFVGGPQGTGVGARPGGTEAPVRVGGKVVSGEAALGAQGFETGDL